MCMYVVVRLVLILGRLLFTVFVVESIGIDDLFRYNYDRLFSFGFSSRVDCNVQKYLFCRMNRIVISNSTPLSNWNSGIVYTQLIWVVRLVSVHLAVIVEVVCIYLWLLVLVRCGLIDHVFMLRRLIPTGSGDNCF